MKDTIAKHAEDNPDVCKKSYLPIRDTLDLVGGKWKLHIIHALARRPMRFKELQREIGDITSRVLSKELKELEANELINRTVYDTSPVTVEYSLTKYGSSLKPVVTSLYEWGVKHRERILRGRRS